MADYIEDPRAWSYTRGVAKALGVSLTAAVVDGWLSRQELAGLVATCQKCGKTGDCTGWLAHTPKAEALPGFCPNKGAIEALVL